MIYYSTAAPMIAVFFTIWAIVTVVAYALRKRGDRKAGR